MISACQEDALWFLCILLVTPWRGVYAYWWGNLSGPNLLDEPWKGFIVNPADLPRLWVKRLPTSGERLNHDSQWKCTTLGECKTGISAVLTVTSGLGPLRNRWWILMILMMKMLNNDYCLCHSLFMFTWSCVYMGLWITCCQPIANRWLIKS